MDKNLVFAGVENRVTRLFETLAWDLRLGNPVILEIGFGDLKQNVGFLFVDNLREKEIILCEQELISVFEQSFGSGEEIIAIGKVDLFTPTGELLMALSQRLVRQNNSLLRHIVEGFVELAPTELYYVIFQNLPIFAEVKGNKQFLKQLTRFVLEIFAQSPRARQQPIALYYSK